MTQEERKQTVLYAPADQAAALVFMWVKSGVITLREFKELYPNIDRARE
jgi:hypothetical protein